MTRHALIEEVPESAAGEPIAALYADIRAVQGLPLVNLIWRHLALRPAALEWAWGQARPLYASGEAEAAAHRLSTTVPLPELAPVPPQVLTALGLGDGDRRSIAALLDTYNRGNGLNLVALSALLAAGEPRAPPAPLGAEEANQAPVGPVSNPRFGEPPPPIPALDTLCEPVRSLVLRLNGLGLPEPPREDAPPPIVATLYRHLAHWPAYLALIWCELAEPDRSGTLAHAIRTVREAGARAGTSLAARAGTPREGIGAENVAFARAALSRFRDNAIARMVTIGLVLRRAFPTPPGRREIGGGRPLTTCPSPTRRIVPMNPRIVFVTPFPDSAEAAAEMAPDGFEFVPAKGGSPEYDTAIPEAEYLVGFVSGLIRPRLYEIAPRLALIQLLSAGYDDADLDAARKAGVPIANNGGANSVAVSEHAVLLMLAVYRQLVTQHANMVAGRWRGNQMPRLFELRGKTVGIIGLGSIGKKVARLVLGFGARVIYYDIARLTEDQEDALGVRFRLNNELLREADVVSLHTPLNDSTRHMIGAAELASMKSSAILVNTARGAVVDESALHEALATRTISAAGLDVYDQEPPPVDSPLFRLDNVVLTGHMAGPTFESHTARLRNGFDNVQRVARGEAPLWVIPELSQI